VETSIDDAAASSEPEDADRALPWWQHPLNIITLLVATALVAGMIGWLISDESSDPDGGEVDIGFLQDMRAHHDQAVAMGYMYLDRPDTSPGLRAVARSIVLGQGIEIGRMIEMLRQIEAPEIPATDEAMGWMGMTPVPYQEMPGMATEGELNDLAESEGAAADQLFIQLMAEHHRGGLHMAEFAATEAESADVRGLAETIYASQREEIAELEGLVDQ
jgi:uncharacterized protein (DUF305 family)